MLAISVVIRTFNSARTLEKVLTGLCLTASDEVILVDSGSRDATLQIGSKWGARIIAATGPFHYSKSLNLGFQAARHSWVLVLSSHSIPMVPDFLELYRNDVQEFPEGVVAGYGPSTLSGKSDPLASAEVISFYSQRDYETVGRVCGNGNTIYRRAAWLELPFDETIRTAEDKLWIIEMLRRGYRFAYLPHLPTINRNQGSLSYMFRKGYSDARALRSPSHRPMTIFQFGGALKNLGFDYLRGDIDPANWARYSAHICGQFVASYKAQNNVPNRGRSL